MKLRICFFAIFLNGLSYGQDAHLSMYDAAPLFLNSALTGVVEGDFRVHGQYRTQWKSVNYKPYTSALVSFDMPIKKWGFGIQLNNFRAGAGNFNVFQGLHPPHPLLSALTGRGVGRTCGDFEQVKVAQVIAVVKIVQVGKQGVSCLATAKPVEHGVGQNPLKQQGQFLDRFV